MAGAASQPLVAWKMFMSLERTIFLTSPAEATSSTPMAVELSASLIPAARCSTASPWLPPAAVISWTCLKAPRILTFRRQAAALAFKLQQLWLLALTLLISRELLLTALATQRP